MGLNERRSAKNGALIPWTLYVSSWYVFGGIQIAEEVTVANPCNWPGGESDLPLPLLMNVSPPPEGAGDYVPNHDEGARRRSFTYLGVAARGSAVKVWPQRFASGNPFHAIATVAQAEVFNNKSWDLWTQDWQVQLVPVSKWEDLEDQMTRDLDNASEGAISGASLDEEELRKIVNYLNAINPELVDVFMNH